MWGSMTGVATRVTIDSESTNEDSHDCQSEKRVVSFDRWFEDVAIDVKGTKGSRAWMPSSLP